MSGPSKRPRLIPYVEIVSRKAVKRQMSPPSPQSPSTKRGKHGHTPNTVISRDVGSGSRLSPPVSEYLDESEESEEPIVAEKPQETFTTPIVARISENLFEVKMEVAKAYVEDDENDLQPEDHFNAHRFDAEEIKMGQRIWGNIYEDVTIDGVRYQRNDVVMVASDENYNESNNKGRTINNFGNNFWFCQICYFYEETDQQGQTLYMFHAQWFLHGSRTILNELSHSGALYLLNSCNDNPVNCIFKKCNFYYLQKGEEEPPDTLFAEANDFHCSMAYNEDHAEFADLSLEYLDSLQMPGTCFHCESQTLESCREQPVTGLDGLQYGGREYHIADFIYFVPAGRSKLLQVAQIIKFHHPDSSISVRYLKRHTEYLEARKSKPFGHPEYINLFFDERRLILTSHVAKISAEQLCGVCYVKHSTDSKAIDKWVLYDDHFYLNQIEGDNDLKEIPEDNFFFCEKCNVAREEYISELGHFSQSNSKLVGMELFSGAGGLGLGMNLSNFVDTQYAVEFSPSAALTYKKNHPHTKVYCQDTNTLLKHAIAQQNGENPGQLLSKDGKTYCPAMPTKQDKIDFLFGGPPCQAFSRANHTRRSDDVRSTMPCNMLSFVEYYEPDYFLLENVAGLLDYKLRDTRFSEEGEVIEYGMVKFIIRTLIALGYQVRWKLLQAAQYGVPQSRTRVIFWGAKRGLKLPEFPVPVYAFSKTIRRTRIPGSKAHLPTPTRSTISEDYHDCAPFKPLTVLDAIGDLPPFDWINPRKLYKGSRSRQDADRTWFGKPIPEFNACRIGQHHDDSETAVGYTKGATYATAPQNRYQRWLRQGMKDSKGKERPVLGQHTNRFADNIVESTTTVPLKPGANHKDLPIVLQPRMARPGAKQADKSFYGRVDGNEHFKCAMTNLAPNVKQSWPLHPLQKRIYTVRECARAQGFPDHYIFYSESNNPSRIVRDQIQQIGNAVAVPFALALGKELGAARFLDWKKKQRLGSPVL